MSKYDGCDGPTCAAGGVDYDPRDFMHVYFGHELANAMSRDQAEAVDAIIEGERAESFTVSLEGVSAEAIKKANTETKKREWPLEFKLKEARNTTAVDDVRKTAADQFDGYLFDMQLGASKDDIPRKAK